MEPAPERQAGWFAGRPPILLDVITLAQPGRTQGRERSVDLCLCMLIYFVLRLFKNAARPSRDRKTHIKKSFQGSNTWGLSDSSRWVGGLQTHSLEAPVFRNGAASVVYFIEFMKALPHSFIYYLSYYFLFSYYQGILHPHGFYYVFLNYSIDFMSFIHVYYII